MIGIVIVAHGGLASEYVAALEHVIGRVEQIKAISTSANVDRSEKECEICAAADAVDSGDGVVIVTDMFGASPSNLSLPACRKVDRRILYGANLPMLVKLAKTRNGSISDAVGKATLAGRRYIDSHTVSDA